MFLKMLSSFKALIYVVSFSCCVNVTYASVDIKVGSIIIDDEIEEILSDWVGRLFVVAGLKTYKPKVYLIHNPEINASATVGGQLFVHTGLITKAGNAGQLLEVLAHQVGHIAGGHIAKFDEAGKEAMVPAGVAILLGSAIGLAAGDPSIAMAGIVGGGMAFERSFLKFTRTQESSADQAAMSYLDRLGWGSEGLHDFFKIIDEKTSAVANMIGPYAMSHPLTSDRIKSVADHIEHSGKRGSIPEGVEKDFQRLKAKIMGFTEPAKQLLVKLSNPKTCSLSDAQAINYAQSIAYFRSGRYQNAIEILHKLQTDPRYDAYATEVIGQIYLDQGKLQEAADQFAKGAIKRPKAKYMKVLQAHALLEQKDNRGAEQAKHILIPMTQNNPDDVFGWRLLAIAYGKTNETGMAALALAEEALRKGDFSFALEQCKKALAQLPKGSTGYLRSQDLQQDIIQQKKKFKAS